MPTPESKTCTKCGNTKPLDDFPRNGRGGHRAECKACHCDYVKARYHANIEEARRKNREKARKQYAADPDAARERQRQWRLANSEKHVQWSLNWAKNNPEKVREYKRKWDAANPDVKRDQVRRRRARKRAAEATPYNETDIFHRHNGTCATCSTVLTFEDRPSWEIDHIVPISLGGGDTPANVQLLCRPCNRAKGARLEGQIHLPV